MQFFISIFRRIGISDITFYSNIQISHPPFVSVQHLGVPSIKSVEIYTQCHGPWKVVQAKDYGIFVLTFWSYNSWFSDSSVSLNQINWYICTSSETTEDSQSSPLNFLDLLPLINWKKKVLWFWSSNIRFFFITQKLVSAAHDIAYCIILAGSA